MKPYPTKLQIQTLKEIALIMHQGINTVTEKIQYQETGFPIIQSKHITQGKLDLSDTRFVGESDFQKYKNKYNPQKYDILICNIGTIGKSILIAEQVDFLIAWNIFLLRLDNSKIWSSYCKHYLDYLCTKNYFDQFLTGGTVKFVNKGNIGAIKIPLLSLEKQRQIAEVLDRAEELRSKRREAIAQLDTLTQAIFIEMFGDPVTNLKGWNIKKFREVGTLDRGISKHRPRNAPELLDGIYPLIQTGDVANCGGYIHHYQNTYSEIGLRQSKIWKAGTLCITIAANIAKTGILTFDACFPDSIVGFLAEDFATVEFIRVWLSFLQKTLEETAPESAQKNINLGILRNLDVPFPPLSLQQEFAHRVEAVEKLKAVHRASLSELDALFASLQHRAFRGEL